QNSDLSLPGGAIKGWDRRNAYYYQLIQSLSDHYGFEIDTPFNELDKKTQKIILYGSGKEKIDFTYIHGKNNKVIRSHTFEGVIPNLERRYRDTDSATIREDLAKYQAIKPCKTCNGSRLNEAARHVFINDTAIHDITCMSVEKATDFFKNLKLKGQRGEIAEKIVKEVNDRLEFLINVGLNYLSLDRSADTLSGGEAQRIRLASQIGAGLVGVMYVLDEPSIGLHQRDNQRLLKTLFHLRDIGNTVIVVEHDEEAVQVADHVIDIGPGAGVHGGEVVAQGTPKQVMKNPNSLTGQYLSGKKRIAIPEKRTPITEGASLKINGASGNNLKDVNLEIPVGLFTCITGVSGSGKSTLINDTLYTLTA
ncbi:MAG: excinuclease ABC subunit UvrA, partial [Pseudomonadota bacterium]